MIINILEDRQTVEAGDFLLCERDNVNHLHYVVFTGFRYLTINEYGHASSSEDTLENILSLFHMNHDNVTVIKGNRAKLTIKA